MDLAGYRNQGLAIPRLFSIFFTIPLVDTSYLSEECDNKLTLRDVVC